MPKIRIRERHLERMILKTSLENTITVTLNVEKIRIVPSRLAPF